MNCLLLEREELDEESGRARVEGRRRKHAGEILKASPGDRLRVGVIGGGLGNAQVLALDDDVLELQVELDAEPPPKSTIDLVLALPRPPVFRRLMSTIASLGIGRVWIVGTARTEKSFWQSHVIEPDEIRERMLLGLEQSRDCILPEVVVHRYFESLITDVLPAAIEGRRALIAHPGAPKPCPHAVNEKVTLFVGPEGGMLDFEIEKLEGIGFEPVDLGPRVLRVEPVIPLLVGRIESS